MKAIDIGMVQARRAKLDADIARLREEIAELEAKRSELDIAERIFAELSLEGDELNREPVVGDIAPEEQTDTPEAPMNGEDHSRKPEGIPTVPDMIIEAIRHANSMGARGLDPKGLKAYIRGRYWPGMPDPVPGPIAWRMWKRGNLNKRGAIYSLAPEH